MATGRKKKCCKSGVSASRAQQESKRSTESLQIDDAEAKFGVRIIGAKTKTNFFKASRRKRDQRNRFRQLPQFIRQFQRTSNRLVFGNIFVYFSFFIFFVRCWPLSAVFWHSRIEIISIIGIEWKRKKTWTPFNSNKRTNEFQWIFFTLCVVHAAAICHIRRSYVCWIVCRVEIV